MKKWVSNGGALFTMVRYSVARLKIFKNIERQEMQNQSKELFSRIS
jgi:hypothetical protein